MHRLTYIGTWLRPNICLIGSLAFGNELIVFVLPPLMELIGQPYVLGRCEAWMQAIRADFIADGRLGGQ
jgi:hypothetical protein